MNSIGKNCGAAGYYATNNFDSRKSQVKKKGKLDISRCMMVMGMSIMHIMPGRCIVHELGVYTLCLSLLQLTVFYMFCSFQSNTTVFFPFTRIRCSA